MVLVLVEHSLIGNLSSIPHPSTEPMLLPILINLTCVQTFLIHLLIDDGLEREVNSYTFIGDPFLNVDRFGTLPDVEAITVLDDRLFFKQNLKLFDWV